MVKEEQNEKNPPKRNENAMWEETVRKGDDVRISEKFAFHSGLTSSRNVAFFSSIPQLTSPV